MESLTSVKMLCVELVHHSAHSTNTHSTILRPSHEMNTVNILADDCNKILVKFQAQHEDKTSSFCLCYP